MELDYVKLKQIKPVLSGYIRESQTLLKKSGVPDEKTVHDVRVLMKKSRAILKLAAPQLDKTYHHRDITAMREVGRSLCSMRESSVQRKILKDYKKKYPDIFSQLNDITLINDLLKKQEPITEPSVELRTIQDQVDVLLNKTGYRIRFQSMSKIDPRLLIKELENSYLTVMDIYLSCRNKPGPAILHKFRKKAKDFLYQLYIFKPLNPPVVKSLEKKLDNLTQNLGRVNDLNQIIKTLDYNYKEDANLPALNELVIRFREAQDAYLSKVWPAAFQIFCPGNRLVNVLGFKLLVI
jgi:CHAD domain-containing protein